MAAKRAALPLIVGMLLVPLAGCSLFNRQGPDVTCSDLGDGHVNACEQGIVARCVGGAVQYEICTESVDGVAARDLCAAPWQLQGSFRCSPVPVMVVADVVVMNDANADGKLSPDEAATVRATLENVGAATTSYRIIVSFELDPHVTDTGTPGTVLSNMPPGTEAFAGVNIHVASDTPLGPLPFGVHMVDATSDLRWDADFSVPVVAP